MWKYLTAKNPRRMKMSDIERIDPYEYVKISTEAYYVQKAWDIWGGSFIKGLSEALLHADPLNMKKIHDNWTKEWDEALGRSTGPI